MSLDAISTATQKSHPSNYKRLDMWQKAMRLAQHVYEATRGFPREERFGLTSQIRRCAVSIPSNVAEGWGRGTAAERRQFLRVARGSACELETQLVLAEQLGYLSPEAARQIHILVGEVLALLGGSLRSQSAG